MNSNIYVFDMDDTLVDSHLRYEKGILRVLDAESVPYNAKELVPVINPLGFARTADYFSAMGVSGTQDEIVERLLDSMVTLYTTEVRMMPGAETYLQRLKAEGARLFVLTATPHRVSDACLRANGVYDLFEQVWCTDDFNSRKGEHVLYERVTAALGCSPSDILFFDDGVTAIRTAREAGWNTCGFMPPFAVESAGMEQVAHCTVVSFEELL